jgi:hypothetical protein
MQRSWQLQYELVMLRTSREGLNYVSCGLLIHPDSKLATTAYQYYTGDLRASQRARIFFFS